MVGKQENQVEKIAFAMTAIILNIVSIPVTIEYRDECAGDNGGEDKT